MKRLGRRRTVIDAKAAKPETLREWDVSSWPATFLTETNKKGHVTRVVYRYDGVLTPAQLIRFIQPPEKK